MDNWHVAAATCGEIGAGAQKFLTCYEKAAGTCLLSLTKPVPAFLCSSCSLLLPPLLCPANNLLFAFVYLTYLHAACLPKHMPACSFKHARLPFSALQYLLFAFVYLSMPAECICSEECGLVTFSHAFWFSVQTASTIGE